MGPGKSVCPSCGKPSRLGDTFCSECGVALAEERAQDASDALVGKTLPGGYKVVEALAEGSMGRVYRAEQKTLGRQVAIKVMNPGLVKNPDLVQRFRTEAHAASALNHPNCVRVYDFGETTDGSPYIVMELLSGHELADLLSQENLLPVTRALDMTLQILSALEEAHTHGVVHRDLKPANVYVLAQRGGGDLVKVVDFGLAKLKTALSSPGGLVFGTPEYISPEQATASETDGRTDLYACGVILFEMLTGRLPFVSDDPRQLLEKHVYDKPPLVSDLAPSAFGLDEVVSRALAKDPKDRFQTAELFAEALREIVAHRTGERSYSDRRSWIRTSLRACAKCGALMVPTARFCGECGEVVERESSPISMPSAAIPSTSTSKPERPLVARDAPSRRRRGGASADDGSVARATTGSDRPATALTKAEKEGIDRAIKDAESSGDATMSLVFLEQIAAGRMTAGEPLAAIEALRRGIAIARADLEKGELEDPIRAVGMFSGKLGAAFLAAGQLVEAHHALKDALALTRGSLERADLWDTMAKVARAQGHEADAAEYRSAADREIESSRKAGDPARRGGGKTGAA